MLGRKMDDGKLRHDDSAEQLWSRCRRDKKLRWLLQGVLSSRNSSLGRILLLSPTELFGETQARVGQKLSVRFRLVGLPYISGNLNRLLKTLKRNGPARSSADPSREAHVALLEWQQSNARHAQHLTIAAILETVRRNSSLRVLTSGEEAITLPRVALAVPELDKLDWTPMANLGELFQSFLGRSSSRKPINRFTLNLTGLLAYSRPEITLQGIALESARHFVQLLKARKISEESWRKQLLKLIDLDLVGSVTPTFLWCRKFPADGFAASTSMSWGSTSPPSCPWCGKTAHSIAAFVPTGSLREAMALRDGLLGAAVGWHLIRSGIPFAHGQSIDGTELDFLLALRQGHLLIECKMLSTLVSAKQLTRNIRDAVRQLDRHAALFESRGSELLSSICVLNVTDRKLSSLNGIPKERVISYERYPEWFRTRVVS